MGPPHAMAECASEGLANTALDPLEILVGTAVGQKGHIEASRSNRGIVSRAPPHSESQQGGPNSTSLLPGAASTAPAGASQLLICLSWDQRPTSIGPRANFYRTKG